jgi:hypothetical protein
LVRSHQIHGKGSTVSSAWRHPREIELGIGERREPGSGGSGRALLHVAGPPATPSPTICSWGSCRGGLLQNDETMVKRRGNPSGGSRRMVAEALLAGGAVAGPCRVGAIAQGNWFFLRRMTNFLTYEAL